MGIQRGVSSAFVLFATFLVLAALLRTSHAQGGRRRGGSGASAVTLLKEPEPVYYVSKKTPANITCEALAAANIMFHCAGSFLPPASQNTVANYDEARGQSLVRAYIEVTRAEVASHQRKTHSAGSREDYWCECVAEDYEGVRVRSRRAIVRHAFIRKRFGEEPANQTVDVGESAVFRCVAPQGAPTPEIIWRHNGRRIVADKDDNFVVGDDGFLTLVTVRAKDAGQYECVAKNDAIRRISAKATLTVRGEEEEESDDVPMFLEKPPKDIYLMPNQPFPIICDIQGSNTMTLRCNGQRVSENERMSRMEDREGKRVRIVYNITYAEVENFINRLNEDYRCECVAWYRTPTGDRGWGFETSNASNIYLASLSEDFEAEPSDVSALVGDTATLVCNPPEGKPSPWVYWVFEQQRLDPRSEARFKLKEDGSLVIQEVEASDQGRYYCVAENLVGSRNSRVGYLTVSAEAVVEPTFPSVIPPVPVFTRDLEKEALVNEDGEVTLECTVVAAKQLTFRCNDRRLGADEQDVSRKTSPDRSVSLLTARTVVSYQDVFGADVYSCQCVAWYLEDQEWKYKFSTSSAISLPYLDGSFLYEPKGRLAMVGDSAEFSCEPPEGKPTPQVFWQKDGETIDPEQDSNFIVLADHTLVVEYVRVQDGGQYVCVASNSAGERFSPPVDLEVAYDEDALTSSTPAEDLMTTPTTTPPPPSPTPSDMDTTTPSFVTTTTPHHDDHMMTSTTTTMMMMGESQPFFTVMPDEQMYIVRGQPVLLRCGAMQVSQLLFFCNGQRVYAEDEDPSRSVDPTPGLTFLEKSIEVSREEVLGYEGPGNYTCQCRAYHQVDPDHEGDPKYLTANTIITVAYLRKRFEQSPADQTVESGQMVELVCRAPDGVPEPKVYWLKDGFSLDESDRVQMTAEGSLIFSEVDMADAGDYTCTAENNAATRYSDTIRLRVLAMVATPMDPDVPDMTPSTTTAAPDGGVVIEPEDEDEDGDEDEDEDEDEDGQPETYPEGEPDEEDKETMEEPETTPEGEAMPEGEGDHRSGNQVEVEVPVAGGPQPMFLAEPEAMYYIVKSRPVAISCRTKRAQRITFECNGNNIPQSLVHYENEVMEGEDSVLMASIDVSRVEVENYNEQHDDDFYCQCHAQYSLAGIAEPQNITSSRGYVEVAYLRKMFRRTPDNLTVTEGEFVSLQCEPPEGNPLPQISWLKGEEEVFGDLTTPDNALVFQSISADHAGTYYCVATNAANTRKSYAATITLAGHEGAGGMGIEGEQPEPDVSEEDMMECVETLKSCSVFMPQAQRDQPMSCHTVPQYKSCIDDFLQMCAGIMNEESLRSAQMARDAAERICGGEMVCPEMQKCHMEYLQRAMPDHSARTLPMEQLCTSLSTFLQCADIALTPCGLARDDPSTSLSDVATWFSHYCERVTGAKWEDECSRLTECEVPINQSAVLANMLRVSLWCPQISETLECTSREVGNCAMENDVQDDLVFLTDLAFVTCPSMPEPEGEGDDKNDDDGQAEGESGEPGKSLGRDDENTDNSAWTARASVLLTSLLSVLFAVTACR